MASNTEIISILAAGISFRRMLVPYLISAIFLGLISFYLNNFLIPKSNVKRLEFTNTYIRSPNNNNDRNIHLQLDSNSYAYLGSYSIANNVGIKFSLEEFDKAGKLRYKLMADFIRWDTSKNKWTIQNYYERRINGMEEKISQGLSLDTTLNMKPDEFNRRSTDVEMLDYYALNQEIEEEKFKGSKQVVFYEIEKYKRFAFPFASIILTFIGVSMASRKVRGGIGMHLGLGLLISFSFILFMKISQTFATNGGLDPMLAMWIPNLLFGLLAIVLLKKAPK
jgi:lipopolysaccharide export system permease protein